MEARSVGDGKEMEEDPLGIGPPPTRAYAEMGYDILVDDEAPTDVETVGDTTSDDSSVTTVEDNAPLSVLPPGGTPAYPSLNTGNGRRRRPIRCGGRKSTSLAGRRKKTILSQG
jgi:hypothetical protein